MKTKMIDPTEWHLARSVTWEGITYSQGEPAPVMPVAQAELLRGQGLLMRNSDVSAAPESHLRDGHQPQIAQDYLAGTDIMVLRKIRLHPPAPELLREIQVLTTQHARSLLIQEALHVLCGDAL